MNSVTDRINDLTVETAQTALDGLYFVYRQNGQFIQSWYSTLEANQPAGKEVAQRGIRQAQEAQRLWLQLGQQWVRAATESALQTAQFGLDEMNNGLGKAQAHVNSSAKKAEAASK
jgi:hypothetical protein